MSETPATYQTGNELEKALKDLENRLREITANPDTSIWRGLKSNGTKTYAKD